MQELYLGRQPILDRAQRTVAYELLYRSDTQNTFPAETDSMEASLKVISSVFSDIGLAELAHGRPVFINFGKELLMSELPALNPEFVVVEILEDVEVDDEIYEACRSLRENGFRLALDDFVLHDGSRRLLKLASIVKIDWRADPIEHIARVCTELKACKVTLLAEKIETEKEFLQARELGFDLFQGFFFERPAIVKATAVKVMSGSFIEVMGLLQDEELDFVEIEKVIARDAALSFKLLKIINSASIAMSKKIESIRQALVLLGQRELKRWLMLLMLTQHGDKCPAELLSTAFIRAIFGEKLGVAAGRRDEAASAYIVGLLSVFDAVLKQPFAQILKDLPVTAPIRDALVRGKGPLSIYLHLMKAYEKADRSSIAALSSKLGIESRSVVRCYLDSLKESGAYLQAIA